MKPYEKYKDSGIEWAGKIPSHWKVSTVKRSLEFLNNKRVPLEASERYDRTGEYPYYGASGIIDYIDDYIFDGEYILIGEDGANILSRSTKLAFIAKGKFWVNNHAHILDVPNGSISYFCEQLELNDFTNLASGSAQPKLTKDAIANLSIIVPPISEQSPIAKYLDHQTAIINELIAQKEQLITLLKQKRQAVINEAVTKGLNPNAKMKDSGIEWLGEVPEDWRISKIKYVAEVRGRIGYKGYTKDDLVLEGEGALTLGAKHIDKDNNLNLTAPEYISWDKYFESPEIMIDIDDVIFTQRGSLGKICHINKAIGDATINPSMVILRPSNITARFLYFWLSSNKIQNEVELLQANTAVPMISQFQLSNFPVIIPPNDIQVEIIKFVDKTKSHFDKLIELSNNQLSNLKEYRQSLISEAVTGKIDLRDWQPKE